MCLQQHTAGPGRDAAVCKLAGTHAVGQVSIQGCLVKINAGRQKVEAGHIVQQLQHGVQQESAAAGHIAAVTCLVLLQHHDAALAEVVRDVYAV